jgi:hypothetical protein
MTMSAYPAVGEPAVTAAAMRAAAGLVEQSGLAGLSVTCTGEQISVQVCTWAGDPAQRAAHVARLARLAGTHAYQHDSRASAFSQIQACGQARGIPVTVFTALEVRTRPAGAGLVPLAIAPGGQVTAVPGGQLPAGSRWVTELDDEPAAAALAREMA